MNQTTNAGIDLDRDQVLELMVKHDMLSQIGYRALLDGDSLDANLNYLTQLVNLARRAEPSVAADERAPFPTYKPSGERVLQLIDEARQITDISSSGPISLTLIQIGYIVGHVAAEAARAALASPAVSQKDEDALFDEMQRLEPNWNANGASRESAVRLAWKALHNLSQKDGAADCTEPNREACPRLCGDFCNAIEEARAATTASASSGPCADCGSQRPLHDLDCPVARRATAPSRDSALLPKPWREAFRVTYPNLPLNDVKPIDALTWAEKEIDDLRAALARAPLPAQGDVPSMDSRRAMFQAFSECLVNGNNMTPTEIADRLLLAAPAQVGDAHHASLMREAADTLAEQNWRGDLVEQLRDAAMSASQDQTPEAE